MQCTHVRSLSNLCQITGSPCFDTHKKARSHILTPDLLSVSFFPVYIIYVCFSYFPLIYPVFSTSIFFWKDQVHDKLLLQNTNCYYVLQRIQTETTGENSAQIPLSLVVVNPIPMDNAIATIVIFLWVNPQLAIICIPDVKMVPNIMMVHPPSTD